jgi:hypothetical protein
MSRNVSEIEVEVVEVENKPPAAPQGGVATAAAGWEQRQRNKWKGGVRQVDARWWPLWLIPAVIAVILVSALALVFGLLAAVFIGIRTIFRSLFR